TAVLYGLAYFCSQPYSTSCTPEETPSFPQRSHRMAGCRMHWLPESISLSTHSQDKETSMNTQTENGIALLQDAYQNRSTAFTEEERGKHNLRGLLPPSVETLETQVNRCLLQLTKKANDLERYIYLAQLFDDNKTLFFAVIASD